MNSEASGQDPFFHSRLDFIHRRKMISTVVILGTRSQSMNPMRSLFTSNCRQARTTAHAVKNNASPMRSMMTSKHLNTSRSETHRVKLVYDSSMRHDHPPPSVSDRGRSFGSWAQPQSMQNGQICSPERQHLGPGSFKRGNSLFQHRALPAPPAKPS